MGKRKYMDSRTVYAKLRDKHNEHIKAHNPDKELLSQEKLGKLLNVSKATVCRIENGDSKPDETTLKKYCEIFNVSMEYLTGTQSTKEMKSNTYLKSLGITGSAYNTLKKICTISTDTNNLSAVVNAFLSNEEYAVCFFQNILNYLQAEYSNSQSGHNDNRIQHDLLIRTFEDYINHVVAPQIQTAIKKNAKMKEFISEIPDEIKHADEYN